MGKRPSFEFLSFFPRAGLQNYRIAKWAKSVTITPGVRIAILIYSPLL